MHPDQATWGGAARHTLGISLLAVTVLLWTASSFLASTIFADNTFSKPYFVTFLTTALFSIFLLVRIAIRTISLYLPLSHSNNASTVNPEYAADSETDTFLGDERGPSVSRDASSSRASLNLLERLDQRETARLSLEFCGLWFLANFFQSKSLEYTSVASATILFSTSPIWTLLHGYWIGIESFTLKKLFGVVASLVGVALIAFGDISGDSDEHRGFFPHKTPSEIILGDTLALASAMLYGIYTTRFKKRVGNETRVDMLLFLGFVGVANTLLLWPGFIVLDLAGLEKFEWPATASIREIIMINAAISVISDLTWAYSVALTTPLVVTLGLSLSIPLSIVGQIIINAQGSSISNWIGAAIVLIAFIIVNKEERGESDSSTARQRQD